MNDRKLLGIGPGGSVLAAACCFTPIPASLLGAIGLSAWLRVARRTSSSSPRSLARHRRVRTDAEVQGMRELEIDDYPARNAVTRKRRRCRPTPVSSSTTARAAACCCSRNRATAASSARTAPCPADRLRDRPPTRHREAVPSLPEATAGQRAQAPADPATASTRGARNLAPGRREGAPSRTPARRDCVQSEE